MQVFEHEPRDGNPFQGMIVIEIEPTGTFCGIDLFDNRIFPEAVSLKDGRKVDASREIAVFVVRDFAGVVHLAEGLVVESDNRPAVFGM